MHSGIVEIYMVGLLNGFLFFVLDIYAVCLLNVFSDESLNLRLHWH